MSAIKRREEEMVELDHVSCLEINFICKTLLFELILCYTVCFNNCFRISNNYRMILKATKKNWKINLAQIQRRRKRE